MKKLKTLYMIIATLVIMSSCTTTRGSVTPPVLNVNPSSLPPQSIETAYPYANNDGLVPPDTTAIETAYPSIGNASTPFAEGFLPTAPQDAQEPAGGMASISGILYLETTRQVLTNTQFFLLPFQNTDELANLSTLVAPDVNRGDIIGKSDENGIIDLNVIPPGNYYLAVWAQMNWYLAQASEKELTPLVLDLKAGNRIPLGVIFIELH